MASSRWLAGRTLASLSALASTLSARLRWLALYVTIGHKVSGLLEGLDLRPDLVAKQVPRDVHQRVVIVDIDPHARLARVVMV